MWEIEEENMKIQKEIHSLTMMIKAWKEEKEVGGDNVKKKSDITEMKKREMEREKKTKN